MLWLTAVLLIRITVGADPDPYLVSQNDVDPDPQHLLTVTYYYANLFAFSVEFS
jgi:hypothetical protein